jgi:hypothetical protein
MAQWKMRRWSALGTAGALALLIAPAGCSTPGERPVRLSEGPARNTETVYDIAPAGSDMTVGAIGGRLQVAEVDEEIARAGVDEVEAIVGSPRDAVFDVSDQAVAGSAAPAVVESTLVDSVVGQVNGRPVFAMEFLAPMDARLRAEAQRLPPQEWAALANRTIKQALIDLVRDELLIDEFEQSLSPEQRVGLLYLVEQIRSELVREARGSEEVLSGQLQQNEGVTIDEKVQQLTQKEKIYTQLKRVLGDKTFIPWRDIVAQFRRVGDLYLPLPLARLRVIEVRADDPAGLATVREALGSGAEFESVARLEVNQLLRATGGLYESEVTGPTLAESRIFAIAPLNEALAGLEPGQTAGPIEARRSVYWLRLEEVVDRSRSLYEVQLEIESKLKNARVNEEEAKYFAGLFARGSLTDIQQMERNLMEIAVFRYLGIRP